MEVSLSLHVGADYEEDTSSDFVIPIAELLGK